MANKKGPDTADAYSGQNRRLIEDQADVFRKYLLHEWTYEITPYSLDSALAVASDSGTDDTRRIFLAAGFKAWLTYFLATTDKSPDGGRHAHLQAVFTFNRLSVEIRTLVANKVADTVPHATVSTAIDKMLDHPARRRLFPPANYTLGSYLSYLSSLQSEADSLPSSVTVPPNRASFGASSNLATHPTVIDLTSDQQHVFSGASLQESADLFPDYMSGAIQRNRIETDAMTDWSAAVTMSFPYLAHADCSMSLAVDQTKVEHIAMVLFNAHVEVEPAVQARRVVLKQGTKLMSNSEITLQGAQTEAITKLLGLKIISAIKASRLYQEELQQGIRATSCVSMTIPSSAIVCAVINLKLGSKEGSVIREMLYRRRAEIDRSGAMCGIAFTPCLATAFTTRTNCDS